MVAAARAARPRREAQSSFAADVAAGLKAPRKTIPAKYFYDEAGSQLFEAITETKEYYPTRSEMRILREHADEIAALIPPDAALVEFGSGSNKKIRILLAAIDSLSAYVPVDISAEFLEQEADKLRRDFPELNVQPMVADFTRPFKLPKQAALAETRVGIFPGSTIGNFEPRDAAAFLRNAAAILGPGAVMIVGADLVKSKAVLNAAYNDKAGVTAKFNLNLLTRINRELGGNFDLAAFDHHAFFNAEQSRIEMHLASRKQQKVRIGGQSVEFHRGETIHTENSYKYSLESMKALARSAGWQPVRAWTDKRGYFSIQAFQLAGGAAAVRKLQP